MDPNNPYETWQAVIEKVKSYGTVNSAQVDAFLGRMQPQASSVGFLLATVDTDFIKGQIEKRFLSQIEQALRDLFETEYVVEIEVDPGSSAFMQQIATQNAQQATPYTPPAQPAASQATGVQAGAAPIAPAHSEPAAPATQTIQSQPQVAPQVQPAAATRPSSPQPAAATSHLTGSQIARANGMDTGAAALTFENFIIGDSNRLAYSMAVSVAESPGKSTLNPLFIYGKSGLGKTHLLRAIQNYILETRPDMRVVYIDAQEFITEYSIAAIDHSKDKSSFQAFQSRYLDADALLIDDVQYFQGKSATVNIVFQLFNRLTDAGKQVVLSADRSPKSIDIDERYKSRFNSGGTYDIQPPEVETKLGIIKSFIEEYKRSEGSWDLYVPEDIQMYIAEISSSNVRELKSAVTKVISQMTAFGNPDITLSDVKSLLENHFSAGALKKITVEAVQHEVEQYYQVSHADLIGTKRSRNIAYARHVAIYLCRQMIDIPYNDIGKRFNRDHSTIMSSVEKIEKKTKESRELQEELEIIIKNIREN